MAPFFIVAGMFDVAWHTAFGFELANGLRPDTDLGQHFLQFALLLRRRVGQRQLRVAEENLKLPRKTLYDKLKRFNLAIEAFR